jgi:hypothetical protein
MLTPLLLDLGFRVDPNLQEAPASGVRVSMLTPLLRDLGFRIDPNQQEAPLFRIDGEHAHPTSSGFRV